MAFCKIKFHKGVEFNFASEKKYIINSIVVEQNKWKEYNIIACGWIIWLVFRKF